MARQDSAAGDVSDSATSRPPVASPGKYWWRQHLAAFLANLSSVSTGLVIGWSAQALAVLRGELPGSPLRLDLEQASWVGALVPSGALAGALVAGLLAQRVGRRRALLWVTAPLFVGWLLILCASNKVWMLFLGRFLTGNCAGSSIVLASMYCEEIAEVRVRGTLGSYLDLMVTVGMLWVYVLGALLPYSWYTAASLIPPLIFVFSFCWMPESPVFLMSRNCPDEARKTLVWLRGPDANIEPELDSLQTTKHSCDTQERISILGCVSLPRVDRTTVKTMAIILGFMFFTQANGVNVFIYYITDVFAEAGTDLSPQMSTVVVGVIHVFGTFFPALTVDRVGRRVILAITGVSTGLCLTIMSVYSHLGVRGVDLTDWRWVPLMAMIVFMFMISAGPGPLSWSIMAEMMPMSAKGWGSALAVSFSRLMVVIVVKEFPPMLAALGQDVTYGIFSVMCFLGVGYVYLCMPETKGKTREEIRKKIIGKKIQSKRQENDVC